MPPVLFISVLMGIGVAIIVAKKSTKQPVDHTHLFKEECKNVTKFINRNFDKKKACLTAIRMLRTRFEDHVPRKKLNYEIEQLHALLRNNNSQISNH